LTWAAVRGTRINTFQPKSVAPFAQRWEPSYTKFSQNIERRRRTPEIFLDIIYVALFRDWSAKIRPHFALLDLV